MSFRAKRRPVNNEPSEDDLSSPSGGPKPGSIEMQISIPQAYDRECCTWSKKIERFTSALRRSVTGVRSRPNKFLNGASAPALCARVKIGHDSTQSAYDMTENETSLCLDTWIEVVEHLDWESISRLACATSHTLCRMLVVPLCRRYFPLLDKTSTSDLAAACSIMRTHPSKRDDLLRLLKYEVRMYARRLDENGTKLDHKLKLYRVRVVDFAFGMYRYSEGVRVVGEKTIHNVNLDRIFAIAPEILQNCHKTCDRFDDDGARMRMIDRRGMFEDAERSLLCDLCPVFGFMDAGNILARSSQCVVINPHLRQMWRQEKG